MGLKRTPPPRRSRVGRAALVGAAVAGTVFAAVTGAQFDIADN